MKLNDSQRQFVVAAEKHFGAGALLTRDNINHVVSEEDVSYP